MNLFSVNQVNQVYVAGETSPVKTIVADLTNPGDLCIQKTSDNKGVIYHLGKGGVTRSDIIENVMWATATPAAEMTKYLKFAEITLNEAFISNDAVTPVGQDFILRLAFKNYVGISPEDSIYWKYGMVHVTAGLSESDFYKKLAISFVKNMSREAVKLVSVYLVGESTTEVTMANIKSLDGEYTGIKIEETEPAWILGLKQQKIMSFEAVPTTVSVLNDNGSYDDLVWGDVLYSDGKSYTGGGPVPELSIERPKGSPTAITNGKLAADYEYFFHGERGDQYRMVGWPDYIPTEYMVDPTKKYDFISIHFAYVGPNEGCQKSEKDITILAPTTAANGLGTVGTAIKSALTTKLGITFPA